MLTSDMRHCFWQCRWWSDSFFHPSCTICCHAWLSSWSIQVNSFPFCSNHPLYHRYLRNIETISETMKCTSWFQQNFVVGSIVSISMPCVFRWYGHKMLQIKRKFISYNILAGKCILGEVVVDNVRVNEKMTKFLKKKWCKDKIHFLEKLKYLFLEKLCFFC